MVSGDHLVHVLPCSVDKDTAERVLQIKGILLISNIVLTGTGGIHWQNALP